MSIADSQSQVEAWATAEGLLRRANKILAITHVSPDGDAIGSLLAFTLAMRSLGKFVLPTCQDLPPQRFDYLNGIRDIKQSAQGEFDLVVGLDSSDLQRLGNIFTPAQHAKLPFIVFDHHITNTGYGTVNLVEPGLASTAEVVIKLLRRMNIPITPDIAAALMTGVITDTLAFRTSNTTPDTLASAMDMMRCGANLQDITQRALVARTWDSLRMLGTGITQTHIEERVAYATIPKKLRKELNVKEDRGDGGLVGTLITAYEVDVAVVFVEVNSGEIEIGMRGKPGYDVSQVALELGGGGHPAAAGCTLPGPMRDAVSRVLPRLKQVVREK
jgi:phosphoesterase RecJ-like protein